MSWRIFDPDRHDELGDGKVINALSATEAAERYAQLCCSRDPDEYSYFNGGVDLVANHTETGERVELTVTLRSDPVFTARLRRG